MIIFRTVLHKAAFDGNDKLVELLLSSGADPAVPGAVDDVLAYDMAKDKSTKLTFRRWAGKFPENYDWQKAHVVPLTEDEEQQQKLKLTEKKKKKKKQQQEKVSWKILGKLPKKFSKIPNFFILIFYIFNSWKILEKFLKNF